jgi:hypothetical protein
VHGSCARLCRDPATSVQTWQSSVSGRNPISGVTFERACSLATTMSQMAPRQSAVSERCRWSSAFSSLRARASGTVQA